MKLKVNKNNVRIDKYIAENVGELSRSYIQRLIEDGNVLVNNIVVKSSYKVVENDEIIIDLPQKKELEILPENIDLDILYEDKDILFVNKPKGMVVHPAHGNYEGTLVNAILSHCKDSLSGINGVIRPGIVHRIDKDTSGVLVIAKNDFSHNSLAKQFKEHTINRIYIALVRGIIKEDDGTIDMPIARSKKDRKKMAVDINGRRAVTHFKVLKRYGKYTLIELKLETGRTHQIRVHMAQIGHPLIGDEVYSNGKNEFNIKGQMLHASTLGLIHPVTEKYIEFTAQLPKYYLEVLDILNKENDNE